MKKILGTLKIKWAEYLLEIIVIVIGILLAYTLNSWNEGRKERKLEESFLGRITIDLTDDKNELNRIIAIQSDHKKSIEYLLASLEMDDQINKAKFDSTFVAIFGTHPTFYPNIGSYHSALSSGTLTIVKDTEFLTSITNLYDSYDRLNYNGNNFDNMWLSLRDKYKFERRTKQLQPSSYENPTLRDDLFGFLDAVNFYLNRCQETREMIDEVLNKQK